MPANSIPGEPPPSWLADGHILTVSSRGLSSVYTWREGEGSGFSFSSYIRNQSYQIRASLS